SRDHEADAIVRAARGGGVGDRDAALTDVEALVPDVFDSKAPVARLWRSDIDHQSLLGTQAERPEHIKVIGCGVLRPEKYRLRGHQSIRIPNELRHDRSVQ